MLEMSKLPSNLSNKVWLHPLQALAIKHLESDAKQKFYPFYDNRALQFVLLPQKYFWKDTKRLFMQDYLQRALVL